MRDLNVTYRRLGEIHDAIRNRYPDVPAKSWADCDPITRRQALLFLDLAQHHADVRGPGERPLTADGLVEAAFAAGVALGYHGLPRVRDERVPLYVAFAAALLAEVSP